MVHRENEVPVLSQPSLPREPAQGAAAELLASALVVS